MPTGDNLTDSPRSKHTLTVPGLRAKMFHRSISIADLQAGKRMQSLEPDRTCLRRVPQSTYDLRTHAQTQDQIIRDSMTPRTHSLQKSHSQHPLTEPGRESRYEEKRLRRKFQYKSYQDLHILSMYQENGSLLSLNSIRQPQSATIESSSEASNSTESSPQSSPRPRTPTSLHWADPIPWCQREKTDDDKMRRINARQVHVIEQKDEFEESEHQIVCNPRTQMNLPQLTCPQMQATVLIGPGKPRLIQIHRPMRSGHFSKHQQHYNDHQGNPEPNIPVADWNKTQSLRSPYRTPASTKTRFSDISTISRPDTPTPMSQRYPRLSVNTTLNMDSPKTSASISRPSTSSSNTVFSVDDNKASYSYLPSPSSNHARRRSSTDSCNTSILDESPPRPTYSSPKSTRTTLVSDGSTFDQFCHQRRHYQLLNSVITSTNKALDALAAREFDLISPVLQSFRPYTVTSKCPNTTDHALVAHLNKIFPHTSFSSLSTLAAWLIVDAYYTHLFTTAPPAFTSDSNSVHHDYTSSPSPPPKPSHLPRITISAATSPNLSSQPHSRTTISTPLHPSTIPSKAKSILGIPNAHPTQIHTDPSGCSPHPFESPSPTRSSKSPLTPSRMDEKARIVHASVQTVGRKLVGDLLATEKRPRGRGRLGSGGGSGMSGRRGTGKVTGGECSLGQERAVNALWEACRCVAVDSRV